MNRLRDAWHGIGHIFHTVGTVFHSIMVVAAFAEIVVLPRVITTSAVLREFITALSLLGAFTGYFVTGALWVERSRERCRRAIKYFLVATVLSLLFFFGLLGVLRPQIAQLYPFLQSLREFLLTSGAFGNFIIALCAGVATFFSVAVFIVAGLARK
jgi:hypothetical protein